MSQVLILYIHPVSDFLLNMTEEMLHIHHKSWLLSRVHIATISMNMIEEMLHMHHKSWLLSRVLIASISMNMIEEMLHMHHKSWLLSRVLIASISMNVIEEMLHVHHKELVVKQSAYSIHQYEYGHSQSSHLTTNAHELSFHLYGSLHPCTGKARRGRLWS